MSREHNHSLYPSREAIPDVVPPRLILPADSNVRIVQAAEHTTTTTTPVEVGFAFFELKIDGYKVERDLIACYSDEECGLDIPDDFLESHWGNHMGRILFKAMFDPDRLAPINLVDAYHRESIFRGYSVDEERFFAEFSQSWGVLDRY